MGAHRLVIVDDDKPIRELIRAALSGSTFEVVGEATNGIEAIEVVREEEPDVVLMDIEMPLMNGIEATRHLRARTPGVSIFGFTGSTGADRDEMIRAGAVAVLEKGSLNNVIDALDEWAAEHKGNG